MRAFSIAFAILVLVIFSACDTWRVLTTVDRKQKSWDIRKIEKYAGKFSDISHLYVGNGHDLLWMGVESPVVYSSNGRMLHADMKQGCRDEQYYRVYFQSIADGYYSEDDLVDVVTYASKYMQPGWDSLRDTTFKYAVDFDTVSPLLREIDRLPSTPALTSKFTVILPFFLSGQRRIQTVLINEYISAIEATDADKVFNLWMVYLGE